MKKKLYRSQNERMIGGVCGGLAEYFEIDPTLVRLIFVLLALAGGNGVLIYIIMLLIIPENPSFQSTSHSQPSSDEDVIDIDQEDFEL